MVIIIITIIILICSRRPTKEPKEYESYPQAVVALSRRLRNRLQEKISTYSYSSIVVIIVAFTIHACIITMNHKYKLVT